ncbi:MAG: RNA polymerase sigma factor [Leucobacter sp.]
MTERWRSVEMLEGRELVEAARAGNTNAAAELLTLYLPYWTAAARQIIQKDTRSFSAAGPREEPAELVQEALTKLLELWRNGKGPTSNIRSYVATMMQHAYANKLRSPRSRERPLEDSEIEFAFTVTDDVRSVDLSREIDAMQRAFNGLSPGYRAVLVAITIEGQKPAELTEQFGRPAPAISSMLKRAKQSLFRLMLIDYLSDGGPDCAKNAENLPLKVHDEMSAHGEHERGVAHVRGCERCRRNWARFGAVSSAFGILPLLTIVHLTHSAVPAVADGNEHLFEDTPHDTGAHAERDGTEHPADQSGPDQTGTRQEGADQEPADQAALHQPPSSQPSAPHAVAAGALTFAQAGAAPTNTVAPAGIAAPAATGRVATAIGTRTALALGIALVALAALAPVAHAMFGTWQGEEVVYEGEFVGAHPHGASLDLTLDKSAEGALERIEVDFVMRDAEEWSMDHLALTLSAGTEFVSASNGLDCAASGGQVLCLPTGQTRLGDAFVFEVDNPVPGGEFSLQLQARAGEDQSIGTANGRW